MHRLISLLFFPAFILIFMPATALADEGAEGTPAENVFVDKGIRVEFSVEPLHGGPGAPSSLRENEIAQVRFKVTDASTGSPVTPLQPAAWINLIKEARDMGGDPDMSCKEWISLLLQGSLTFRADVDLNKFFILVMNSDASISVIDPIMGVTGITQLYAMIFLEKRGEDWIEGPDGTYLYVSMPEAGEVAVVDTETFKVIENMDAGSNPVRIAIQPDGRYLWAGNDGMDPERSGVTVIDISSMKVAAHIPTGPGHHEIAFSADSLFAYVTNSEGNSLSIIDTQKLGKTRDLKAGKNPVAVAYSPLGGKAYVAASGDGTITLVDGKTNEISGTIQTEPGLADFRFAPGGRWGFAANEKENLVHILDASKDSITHTLQIGKQPDQFAFTDTYAYVRSLGTADVSMINLVELGRGEAPPVTTVPFGTGAPGDYASHPVADAISPTGEWNTVIALNQSDKFVYYYLEGMVAPMGSYTTYGRTPRAVRVVDRSLRETQKGVYSGKFKIPVAGKYRAAFLLDAPWLYNCFDFTAGADPALPVRQTGGPLKVEVLTKEQTMKVGEPFSLRFSLTRSSSGGEVKPSEAEDIVVLVTRLPNWRVRKQAKALGEGSYEVSLTPDRPGLYHFYIFASTMSPNMDEVPYIFLKAETAEKGM